MVATARGARLHPAWIAAGVAFVALLCAAGFRAAPGVLMVPLQEEFGWSRGVVSLAVGVNLVLFGVTAPFAAALMERFGVRAVTSVALGLIAAGSGLSVAVTGSWQLVLLWGVLIGLGTGSMALVFAAIVANRWFVRRRELVMGVLTAASATGQLVFLPVLAWMSERSGWRSASLVVAAAALAVIPLVLLRLPNGPADLGVAPYGAPADPPVDSRGTVTWPSATLPVRGPASRTAGAPERATAGPARRALATRPRPPAPEPSGPWRSSSRSAGRRPTGWSPPTSSPRPTATACPRPPPPACWPWSASLPCHLGPPVPHHRLVNGLSG
jgi:MFS family permease